MILKIMALYNWARDERVSFITTYWKVIFSYHGKEVCRVFMGDIPRPMYGTGPKACQVYGYKGLSLFGKPQEFLVESTFQPQISVERLGKLSPPIFSASQRFTLKNGGSTERHITSVEWKHGGWWYLVESISTRSPRRPEWMSETSLQAHAKLLPA